MRTYGMFRIEITEHRHVDESKIMAGVLKITTNRRRRASITIYKAMKNRLHFPQPVLVRTSTTTQIKRHFSRCDEGNIIII